MSDSHTLKEAQQRLVTIWVAGFAPSYLLVATRTFTNWESVAQDVWAWFSPTTVPTLLLVVGGYLAATKTAASQRRRVEPYVYRLTAGISVIYLLAVLVLLVVTLHAEPYAALVRFRTANLALGILQGLVTATLGYFFVSAKA